jgi:hypothetical protein
MWAAAPPPAEAPSFPVAVEVFDVVELGDGLLGGDFGGESGVGGA